MSASTPIPVFQLFGETGRFPDIIHIERIRDRARLHDWKISPHRHREMVQLFHMEKGEARVRLDNKEVNLGDRQFLYIPAQVVHGFSFRQGSEGTVLSIPLAMVASSDFGYEEMSRHIARPVLAADTDLVITLLGALSSAFYKDGTFRANVLAAMSQALLSAIAEISLEAERPLDNLGQKRMAEFEGLLRQNLSNGWGAAEFATALAITPGHLNRICRAATGTNATHHIETARMTEASRLLAFTQLSVAEIGYRLGYEDPPYFSRRFRIATGETPSAYRARFGA